MKWKEFSFADMYESGSTTFCSCPTCGALVWYRDQEKHKEWCDKVSGVKKPRRKAEAKARMVA